MASSDGHESRRRREGAATLQNAEIAHADGLARDGRFFDHFGREVGVLDVGADLLDDLRATRAVATSRP